jgi:tetratricopeptide (TPR) repeat protein
MFGAAIAATDLSEAEQLMEDGWMDDAETLLLELSKKHPNNPEIYYQLARVYLIRDDAQTGYGGAPWNNLNQIEDYAKKAIELNPKESKYYVIRGHGVGLKALRGGTVKKFTRAKSAKKAYETAVELDPNNIDARTSLIEYHMQAPGIAGGNKDEARRQATAVAKIDSAEGFLAQKTVYLYEKNYESLETEIQKVLDARPSDKVGYVEYSWLCYRRDDFNCVVTYVEKIITIDPEDVDVYWQLHRVYIKQEKYGEAEAALKKAIATKPEEAYLYRWLGDFYQTGKRWDDAIALYQQSLEVDPTYTRSLYKLGETYVLSEQNLDAGEDCFNRYLTSRLKCWWPERALAHCELAKIYSLQGDKKAAVAQIKKAKKLNPNNDEIRKTAKKLRVR